MRIMTYKNYKGKFYYEHLQEDPIKLQDDIEQKQLKPSEAKPTTTNVIETGTPQKADISKIEGEGIKKKQLQSKLQSVELNNPVLKLRKFINLKL